jgi:cell division protein DivIC
LKKVILHIKNKYILAFVLLFFWLLIFDKYDLISLVGSRIKLYKMNNEKEYYLNEIRATNQSITELTTNPENLEKFAREEYLMKKEDEDIFVVIRK